MIVYIRTNCKFRMISYSNFIGDHFSLNGFDQPEDAPMDFNDQVYKHTFRFNH